MRKETLIEIILANTGGLFAAIGLCMINIVEWNMYNVGLVLLIVGIISILAIIPVYIKNHKKVKIKPKKILIRVVAFLLAVFIGIGISQIIAKQNIILGIIIWIIGLIVSILSYPIYQYFKKEKLKLLKTTFGTIGCILILIGMCMTFLEVEVLKFYGTIIGLSGVICMIIFAILNKKANGDCYYVDLRFVVLIITEFIGGFLTVYGIIKVYETDAIIGTNCSDFTIGLLSCIIGFFICALILPIYIYLKTNNIFDKELKIDLKNKENVYPFRNIIMLFFIYGFIGWIIEFSFFGATNGIFANRGFLHLPILPIYGFGGAAVTLVFSKNQKNVFIKSALMVSVLEYFTSYVMEKAFNLRWWDYTTNPLNINGRVCMLNSTMFGFGGYIMAKFVSPYVNMKLNTKSKTAIRVINTILLTIIIADFSYTIFHPNTGLGITYNV
ncbi:MAG: putative ABC transporter permease [Clostridia bacterium]|nr:putative ABC transporter permease [Clostridia bacterium]